MADCALMVDASCDLPKSLMDQLDIICVPGRVQLGEQLWLDNRDPDAEVGFLSTDYDNGRAQAEVMPPEPQAYLEAVLEHAMLRCDDLVVLTPLREFSPLYTAANKATVGVATATLKQRMAAGRKELMRVFVEDSRSLFAAHGLTAWNLGRVCAEGGNIDDVRANLRSLTPHTMGYCAVDSVRYIAGRERDDREKPSALMSSIDNWLDMKPVIRRQGQDSKPVAKVRNFHVAVERMLLRVAGLIEEGALLVPRITLAYAGGHDELMLYDGYDELVTAARMAQVELAMSSMSLSSGVVMGRRALALGLVAQDHDF